MKIALVSQPIDPVLPGFKNSMGVLIYEIGRRLARTAEVVVYTRASGRVRLEHLEGITYRRVLVFEDFRKLKPVLTLLRRLWGRGSVKRPRFASRLYYLDYALQVAMDLRARKCDVVHLVNFSQLAPVIKFLNPGIKVILHMQCQWLSQLDREMIASRLKHIDLVVGCSEYITQKARDAFPEHANRCVTVHNGADLGSFNSAGRELNVRSRNGNRRLLFVGRISPEKGLHVLIEAMPRILASLPNTELTIVGPKGSMPKEYIVSLSNEELVSGLAQFYNGKDYFSSIQGQVESLKLSSCVSFAGALPHNQVVDHYRSADLFVIPSFSEAFPMILVEAMACQVPVVATRVGGIEEAFDGNSQAGVLVEPGNPHELADAIVRLLGDEELRRSMALAGGAQATKRFSWDWVAEQTRQQHGRLLSNEV
jgi:glycosyltransferase involved in cell wall biosynthesis